MDFEEIYEEIEGKSLWNLKKKYRELYSGSTRRLLQLVQISDDDDVWLASVDLEVQWQTISRVAVCSESHDCNRGNCIRDSRLVGLDMDMELISKVELCG